MRGSSPFFIKSLGSTVIIGRSIPYFIKVLVLILVFRNVDFGDLLPPHVRANHKYTTYDLMCNIVHDGEPGPGKGTYRAHILHKVFVLFFCNVLAEYYIYIITTQMLSNTLNPFPNKPWFLRVYSSSLLKTL